MIIIQFSIWPHKKHLFSSFQQVEPMQKVVIDEIRKRFDAFSLAHGCGVGNNEEKLQFQLQLPGICLGSDENTRALIREINFMLAQLGLKDFLQLSILTDSHDSTMALTYESIVKAQAVNSNLLEQYNVDIETTPTKFICCISGVIMDYPVYIKGGNDRYDLNSLRKWYIQTDQLRDPVRKTYVDPLDIIHDGALQAEINSYVGKAIEKALEQSIIHSSQSNSADDKKKIKELMTKYNLSDASPANRETALRRAAAEGDVENLKFLLSQGVTIDKQAPNSQKTALHWAVIRGKEN